MKLHSMLAKDKAMQTDFIAMCQLCQPITFKTMFWTFQPRREFSEFKHVPFVTWPVQDEAIFKVVDKIRYGGDLLVDKSREMGATWIQLGCFFAEWLWMPDTTLLVISRKEEYVWKKGNPDSLYWKLRYLYDHLPEWSKPPMEWAERHMLNQLNGSVIDGESTTGNVGAGGRRQAVLCDEFARVKHDDAQEIQETLSDTTPTRIFNSTPTNRGHPFGKLRFGGQVEVLILPWWHHPNKKEGMYTSPDLNVIIIEDIEYYRKKLPKVFDNYQAGQRINYSRLQAEILTVVGDEEDKNITFIADGNDPSNEQFHSPTGRRSPWYDKECRRRSKRDKAINIDMDHVGAGDTVFNNGMLMRMIEELGQAPAVEGELTFNVQEDTVHRIQFVRGRGLRRLKWFAPLAGKRPDQSHNYIIGCDIALGTGQSNSVASVYDCNLNRKVGRWTCPNTSPTHFAELVMALGRWVGGVTPLPFLIWEANGPGQIFDRRIWQIGYDFVYYTTDERRTSRKRAKRRGWHSSEEAKMHLLVEYDAALEAYFHADIERRQFANPDIESLREAEDYIFHPDGKIGPAAAAEYEGGAKRAHGDMVIADALTCLARFDQPQAVLTYMPQHGYGTFIERRKIYQAQQKAKKESSRWLL